MVIFQEFLSSADFFKINSYKKSFRNAISVSNSLDSEQAWPGGNKTFFMLNSVEHEFSTAHIN